MYTVFKVLPLIAFFLAVSPATTVFAQTCTAYVNATDGDDANPGTLISPYRSIEFAYEAAPESSVICVAAGEYFFGNDSDGISLSIAEKGMTFVLNGFAGEDEIRFSESAFSIDVGSAVIQFLQGSTDKLAVGAGIANIDDPSAPELLNFVHTFRLISGTIDVSDVIMTLEESVGAPGYVNPDNPSKTAPVDAQVAFGDAVVVGTINYEPAERAFLINPAAETGIQYSLPPELDDDQIVFENASDLTIPEPLNIGRGSLVLRNTGSLSFFGRVSIDTDGGSAVLAPVSGSVTFASGLYLEGSRASDVLIQHSGSGNLHISRLTTSFTGLGGDVQSQFTVDGGGQANISQFEQISSADGSELLLDINVISGEAELGEDALAQRLPGGLNNFDRVSLSGPIATHSDIAGTALFNTGSIHVGPHKLSITYTPSIVTNSGSITAETTGVVEIVGSSVWTGNGTVPKIAVFGLVTIESDISASGPLLLQENAEFNLSNGYSFTVDGALTAGTGTRISIGSGSTLDISSDIILQQSTISLGVDARLKTNGALSLGNSSFSQVSGWIELNGSGSRLISATSPLVLPGILTSESDIVIGQDVSFREIDIAGGGISIQNMGSLFVQESARITGGYLRTPSAASVLFNGPVLVDNGVLNLGGSVVTEIRSDLNWLTSSAVFPVSGLTVSGDQNQHLTPSADFALSLLTIIGANTRVIVDGRLQLTSDLILAEGILSIQSGSELSVAGNVVGQGGILTGDPDGIVWMTGVGARTILGLDNSVLPSVYIDGPSVTSNEDLVLSGSLDIVSGAFDVDGGSTILIDGQLTLGEAALSLASGTRLVVTEAADLTFGSCIIENNAILEFGDSVVVGVGVLAAEDGTIRFGGGQEQLFDLSQPLTIGQIDVLVSGTAVVLGGQQDITVRRVVSVAAGSQLSIGSQDIVMSGEHGSPGLTVDGIVRTGTGAFRFIGPGLQGSVHTLSGAGIFGNIEVNLDSDADYVRVSGSSPSLRFSGEARFISGSIDAAGASIIPSSSYVFPGIVRNLSDEVGIPGRIDGGRFFDSSQELVFNPGGAPYDISYIGSLLGIYVIGAEFLPEAVRDFSIDISDPLNTPSNFGIQISFDAIVTGSLSLSEGSLLRLDGVDLSLPTPRLSHPLDGSVTGPGNMIVSGDGSSLFSPAGTGDIRSVVIANATQSQPVILSDIHSIGLLEIEGGAVLIQPPSPGVESFNIESSLILNGGVLTISRTTVIGRSPSGGNVNLMDGVLAVNDAVNVFLGSQTEFTVGLDASVELSSIGPSPTSSEGFIVFEGDGSISSAHSLPRVRVDFNPDVSASDNVTLLSNLVIADQLHLLSGDLLLGNADLEIAGTVFINGNARPPLDETDGIKSTGGRVLLTGTTMIKLDADLNVSGADVLVDPGAENSVDVIADQPDVPVISVSSGHLILESGLLNLGDIDVDLEADTEGVLSAQGGQVTAGSGTIIISGGPATSLTGHSAFVIPNLSLRGRTRLAAGSEPLTVTGQLAFGVRGSDFVLGGSDRLFLSENAILLRQGSGVLSHAPVISNSFDLFYDLDDGSISGYDTMFGPGVLPTGFELSANAQSIRNLGIMAGARSGSINTVLFTSNVRVANELTLYSGRLDFGANTVSMADNATVTIDEIDDDAPVLWNSGSGYLTEGLVNLNFHLRYTDYTTNNLTLPPGSALGHVNVYLGDSELETPLRFVFHTGMEAVEYSLGASSPESTFQLNGSEYRITGPFDLNGGTLSASSPVQINGSDSFVLSETAIINGDISVSVDGPALIHGNFAGSGLEVGDDLSVTGVMDPDIQLRIRGSDQIITSARDWTVRELEIAMDAEPGATAPTVSLTGSNGPFTLSVSDALVLARGVVKTGQNAIRLLGAQTEIQLGGSLDHPSHIEGSVVRYAPSDFSGSLLFPTGSNGLYRPLSFDVNEPLPGDTWLTASHSGAPPFGIEGLPIERPNDSTLSGLLPYSWDFSSSLDYGPSQVFSLVVSIPEQSGAHAEYVLVSRERNRASSDWSVVGAESNMDIFPDVIQISATDIRSGLDSSGLEVGIAVPTIPDAFAEFQFVHAYPLSTGESIQVNIDGNEIAGNLEFPSALPVIPVALGATAPETHRVEIYDAISGNELFTTDVTLTPDQRTTAVYLPLTDGAAGVATGLFDVSNQVPPNQVAIGFLHASPDFPIERVVFEESGAELFQDGTSGDTFSPVFQQAIFTSVQLVQSVAIDIPDRYTFDFSLFQGQIAYMLLSGYLDLPGELGQHTGLGLSLVLSDGSIVPGVPNVANETNQANSDMPETFKLLGNYPNPFNPRTTILYDLPFSAHISLTVVDILGRVVSRTDHGQIIAGRSLTIDFDASRLASGTYFYRLDANGNRATRSATGKMVLLR